MTLSTNKAEYIIITKEMKEALLWPKGSRERVKGTRSSLL